MHRSVNSYTRLAAMSAVVLILTGVRANDVPYAARQERVPDFGQFVPEHEIQQEWPYDVMLERVTTAVPWGRGMAKVDGELIVLSRGRHRGEGGVSQDLVDHAGVLWRVDTAVSEPVVPGKWAGNAVRDNAAVFARPTSPPFHLYDYTTPPEDDVLMGRPYCALAWDEASRNFFVCAYSGAELATGFRKHGTDAVYRYDLRDSSWHVVEQHDPNVVPREELKAVIPNTYYPHHDPATNPPPHGWPNGADGCISVGSYLYVPAKDNHLVIQYDLDNIRRSADAGPPNSRPVMGPNMVVTYPGGEKHMELMGPSGVAEHDGYLYVGYRTTSVVVRVPLDEDGNLQRSPAGTLKAELIAVFEPWNPDTKRSGNLYDLDIDAHGDLFVSMGREGKIWRITPDPQRPFYGNEQSNRPTTTPPFLDMTEKLGRKTGCNNIYIDDEGEYLYISSRNNDTGEGRMHGTIYRAKIPRHKAAATDMTSPR